MIRGSALRNGIQASIKSWGAFCLSIPLYEGPVLPALEEVITGAILESKARYLFGLLNWFFGSCLLF